MDAVPKIKKILSSDKIKKYKEYFLRVVAAVLVICVVLHLIDSNYIILKEGILLPRPGGCFLDFPSQVERNRHVLYCSEIDGMSQVKIDFKRKDINQILEKCREGIKNHQEYKQIKESQIGGFPSYLVYGEYEPDTQSTSMRKNRYFFMLMIPEKEIVIHCLGTESGCRIFENEINKIKFLWI